MASYICASTHGDHTVKIIDFSTGKVLRVCLFTPDCYDKTLIGHPRTPWSVRFHPRNPDLLASGCIGSNVIVWDWKKGEIIACTTFMENVTINSLDWHPRYVLTCTLFANP